MGAYDDSISLAASAAALLQGLPNQDEGRRRTLAALREIRIDAGALDDDAPLDGWPTVIHNRPEEKDPLFLRVAIDLGNSHAFADIAVRDWLGQPLIGLSEGIAWEPKALLEMVIARGYEPVRWFSYNRRDVALFCLKDRRRTYVDALRSVPTGRLVLVDETEIAPWSARMSRSKKAFYRRLYEIFRSSTASDWEAAFATGAMKSILCSDQPPPPPPCVTHVPQMHIGWCLPAAIQSLLGFYRIQVDKACLAAALGLRETTASVLHRHLKDALSLIQSSSRHQLWARLVSSNDWSWAIARSDIDAVPPRPFIAVGGHARTGVGYGFFELQGVQFEGLMYADPYFSLPGTSWESSVAMGGSAIRVRA